MTSTIAPVFEKLKIYDKINVIDVGAARASFLVELEKLFDMKNVYSIGIDPIEHGISSRYNKFFNVCVDNVDNPIEMDFHLNSVDDQAGTLAQANDERISQFNSIKKVKVLNLNSIIDSEIDKSKSIHFIKIDAEGRDMHIVKSISDDNLKRIKFIAIECSNLNPRFESEYNRNESIQYMKGKNFELVHVHDAEKEIGNGLPVSDIVFMNKEEI